MKIKTNKYKTEQVGRSQSTELTYTINIYTRSMQGMFGASMSELYLLIKSLMNIGRAVDLCRTVDLSPKKIHS